MSVNSDKGRFPRTTLELIKEIAVVTRINFRLIATIVLSPFLTAPTLVQTSKGFFVGNITDQDGAVIVGAQVKIVNANTGVTRDTTSTVF